MFVLCNQHQDATDAKDDDFDCFTWTRDQLAERFDAFCLIAGK